jgi:hypothetical protein
MKNNALYLQSFLLKNNGQMEKVLLNSFLFLEEIYEQKLPNQNHNFISEGI